MPGGAVLGGMFMLAALAGVSFVFQQAVNANLRAELGYPFWAGFVSYLGGTIAMLVMVFAMREPWLSGQMTGRTSLVSWTGGIWRDLYRHFYIAAASNWCGNTRSSHCSGTDGCVTCIRSLWHPRRSRPAGGNNETAGGWFSCCWCPARKVIVRC
jgi:hypothetical protein